MTELQKKQTLGVAVASLICGCFFFIPFLGLLLGVAAIVLGIVALVKISNDKEKYGGKGLAISGIVMGAIAILMIPVIALLAAIAIPNLLRAKISANDALAQSTLRTLATASETYATVNKGQYPLSVQDLINANPPYISQSYCYETIAGYIYDCQFSSQGYVMTATPVDPGSTGTSGLTIETGGVLTSEENF